MTTKVIIVTSDNGAECGFKASIARSDQICKGEGNFFAMKETYVTWIANPLHIRRQEDRADGYILNCGPRTIQMAYWLEESGGSVGPTSDHIAPGQFKEIGAAKGVIWTLNECD